MNQAIFKSEVTKDMRINFGLLLFVSWFLVGMWIILSWVYWTFSSYWSIYAGISIFFFCICSFMFWFAYRYRVPFLEIYEYGIYLRHKIFLWKKEFYPYNDVQNVELRDTPAFYHHYSNDGSLYSGGGRLVIYLNGNKSYELLDTFCWDLKGAFQSIKDRLIFNSSIKETACKCELCDKKGVSYRCTKCGAQICDDCGEADECLLCRLHTLMRRALICFSFYILPIFCLIYGEIELHLPFLTLYQFEFDMRFAGGYSLFMWAWLNGLTGIGATWLGFGFFFAGLSILKYENMIVWERKKPIIITSCIIAFIILLMKSLYFIQVLIGRAALLKIMLIVEVGIGLLFFYFTFRIASYKAKSRDLVQQSFWSVFILVSFIYALIYLGEIVFAVISLVLYLMEL